MASVFEMSVRGGRCCFRHKIGRGPQIRLAKMPNALAHARCGNRLNTQQMRMFRALSSDGETVPSVLEMPQENAQARNELKKRLETALEGVNRGVFGVKAAVKEEIVHSLSELEAMNPLDAPTEHLDLVSGEWKLLFSTIAIMGLKRTKLGLRQFISLGDFIQKIDIVNSLAVNKVQFSVAGFDALMGGLTIEASYVPVSPSRVDIKFIKSTLDPDQLQRLFEKNYDLLLSIFNPEGWLEITYVDETHRIGRDDKGNVFYLERM